MTNTMYKVYLFNLEGRYVSPVYYDDLGSALAQVLPFLPQVPRIMITNSENLCVFEAKDGGILFPDGVPYLLNNVIPINIADSDNSTFRRYIKNLKQTAIELAHCSDQKEKKVLSARLNSQDLFAQAYAAVNNLNVYGFGYRNPSVFLAELDAVS